MNEKQQAGYLWEGGEAGNAPSTTSGAAGRRRGERYLRSDAATAGPGDLSTVLYFSTTLCLQYTLCNYQATILQNSMPFIVIMQVNDLIIELIREFGTTVI